MSDVDPAKLSRVLRQHARSLRLMGVEAMPIGQPSEAMATSASLTPAPNTSASNSSKPHTPVLQNPVPQPKPMPKPPKAVEPPSAASLQKVAPATVVVIEPKIDVHLMDPERKAAQKLLDEIRERYEREAPHKHFVTDHHSIVFGEGDPRARLMFIGEAPGAEEDKCGRPFVGRAGQLLDKMIVGMGITRQQVYIANVLKTRPPNNATPTSDECARCAPFLYEQIAAIRPEAIVTLGLPASRVILNSVEPMNKLRGHWHTFTPPQVLGKSLGSPVPVMPTYHPAFLLRAYTRENREKVWSDLVQVTVRLGIELPKKSAVDS